LGRPKMRWKFMAKKGMDATGSKMYAERELFA
jgi:hypothetical protein